MCRVVLVHDYYVLYLLCPYFVCVVACLCGWATVPIIAKLLEVDKEILHKALTERRMEVAGEKKIITIPLKHDQVCHHFLSSHCNCLNMWWYECHNRIANVSVISYFFPCFL